MKTSLYSRLQVKNGVLDFPNKAQEKRFYTFLKEIPDGTSIDVDEDNDLVMLYDNSASAMVKVKAQQLHTTEALQWMGL